MKRRLILLTLFVLAAVSCGSADVPPSAEIFGPRNIILFIGDGMGTTHFTLLDAIRGEESTLSRFSSAALVTTHSASSRVTDSGAAATALATGIKTTNAALSVTPSGEPVETVLELAERSGMMTGLVTTTGFWDATPAAFASHTMSRRDAESIVQQMLSSGVDLIISNGSENFGVQERPTVEQLADMFGYHPVMTAKKLVPSPGKILALFPGNENDLDHPEAPLPILTRYAIAQLTTGSNGFFLMIESEGTDTASHHHATDDVIESLRFLDEAVAIALDFAETNGETLVLFTGDHETGALQISPPKEEGRLELTWYTGGHTGQALPLFAFGPGAEMFAGWIDNTDIGTILKKMVRRE